MDLILRAQEKREQLRAELARIEAFLATAFELEQEFASPAAPAKVMSDAAKADAPAQRVSRSRGGSGADTLKAVVEILTERGQPMSTRDLLPLVLAKGIEVGGKDAVATLSARISKKGIVDLDRGKWWLVEANEGSGATASDNEEATDTPSKDESAASLFNANQGGDDAAALAS